MLLLFGQTAPSGGSADGKFRGLLALTLNEEESVVAVSSKGFAGWSQPYEDEGHRRKYEREKRSREQELRRSIERAYAELTGEKEQAKQFPTPVTTAAIARIVKQEPDYRRFEIQTDRLQALIGMYIEDMERQAQAEAIRLDDEVAALLLLTAI